MFRLIYLRLELDNFAMFLFAYSHLFVQINKKENQYHNPYDCLCKKKKKKKKIHACLLKLVHSNLWNVLRKFTKQTLKMHMLAYTLILSLGRLAFTMKVSNSMPHINFEVIQIEIRK